MFYKSDFLFYGLIHYFNHENYLAAYLPLFATHKICWLLEKIPSKLEDNFCCCWGGGSSEEATIIYVVVPRLELSNVGTVYT